MAAITRKIAILFPSNRFIGTGLQVAAAIALCFAMTMPLVCTAQTAPGRAAGKAADEAAIHKIVDGFSSGWNHYDAHAMCASLADDGDYVSWRGEVFHGRKAYEQEHVMLFSGLYSHTHRTDTVKRIWFITPEVASVDDYYTMTGAKKRDGSGWPYREGYYNFIMKKQNGRWVVTLSHAADFNVTQPSSTAAK